MVDIQATDLPCYNLNIVRHSSHIQTERQRSSRERARAGQPERKEMNRFSTMLPYMSSLNTNDGGDTIYTGGLAGKSKEARIEISTLRSEASRTHHCHVYSAV
jgi:hypothetical protein